MAQQLSVDIAKEAAAASKALAPAVKRLKRLLELDPKALPVGKASDLLYDVREAKAQAAHLVDALVDDILTPVVKALEEHFIMTLAVDEATGVQGGHSRVQVTQQVVPVFPGDDAGKGREAFLKHVLKTKQFDLLKADIIARDAVRERWDNKAQVPGVTKFIAKRVSCTKLNGRKK